MHQQHNKQAPVFVSPITRAQAKRQANLNRALADPYRLQILALLGKYTDRMTVMDIVIALDHIEQPSVSHHLRVLRDAGLIDYRKEGLYAYYFLQMEVVTEAYTTLFNLLPVIELAS